MKHFAFFLLCLLSLKGFSQSPLVNPRYQKPLWLVYMGYKACIPAGNLALRYGYTSGGGMDITYKTKNNFLWGINSNIYFGRNVRDVNYVNIFKDSRGYVFADDGTPVFINASMRGSQASGVFGKLLPIFLKKPQLSLLLQAGAGFTQHKYLFSAPGSAQFSKEYRKGYDRLSNGFALTEEIGICNLGLYKLVNFKISMEFTQAFTKNRRYYDYATKANDTKTYLDLWIALKCYWILPINAVDKKEPVYFK